MNDSHSSLRTTLHHLWQDWMRRFRPDPNGRQRLVDNIRDAEEQHIIDPDTVAMM